jgi:protein SCO1/2
MLRPLSPCRRRPWPAAAAAAGALAIALAGCGGSGSADSATKPPAQQFEGAALPPTTAPGFRLTDEQGRTVTLAAGRGRVTVLAFLFSGCRACVVISQQLRGALDQLASPPRVLLVSVDPAADTPDRVRAFLAATGLAGRVSYLSGPPAELARTWRAYHVVTPAHGLRAFETAAPVLLIDGGGRQRVLFEEEQLTPEALAHDIRTLEDHPAGSGPGGPNSG